MYLFLPATGAFLDTHELTCDCCGRQHVRTACTVDEFLRSLVSQWNVTVNPAANENRHFCPTCTCNGEPYSINTWAKTLCNDYELPRTPAIRPEKKINMTQPRVAPYRPRSKGSRSEDGLLDSILVSSQDMGAALAPSRSDQRAKEAHDTYYRDRVKVRGRRPGEKAEPIVHFGMTDAERRFRASIASKAALESPKLDTEDCKKLLEQRERGALLFAAIRGDDDGAKKPA